MSEMRISIEKLDARAALFDNETLSTRGGFVIGDSAKLRSHACRRNPYSTSPKSESSLLSYPTAQG